MDKLLLIATFLGQMQVTSYRSVPAQTDASPYITSVGYRTNKLGVAVSQDQICKVNKKCRRNIRLVCDTTKLHYDDLLYIDQVGFRQVFDVMHERHVNRLDVWTDSLESEKQFHRKFKDRKLKIWVVQKL